MANPYSITPAGNYGRELMGLGGIIGEMGDARREEEKIKALKEGAMAAYKSGPDAMYKFGVENPGYASAMNAGAGRQAEKENKKLAKEIMKALIETPDMDKQERTTLETNLALTDPKAYEAYRKATKTETSEGVTPTDIDDFVDRANRESLRTTGKPLTPGKQNEAALRFKRAQAGEVREKKQAAAEEKRAADLITRGRLAAESTATIRRAIDLLETVKTGGVAAASLTAKRIFGVEGADEGELSNTLGKAVLSQLRETFGAQFTESEGKRLERIEAAFGKSPAANKRLLAQTLKIAERTAARARKAALKRGDMETVNDIDDLLSFSLSLEDDEKTVDEMTDEELSQSLF